MVSRRTPQGVRGLKSIEHVCIVSRLCRTPQGVRGLKSGYAWRKPRGKGRTPQGVRGLKLLGQIRNQVRTRVAPRKGCVD